MKEIVIIGAGDFGKEVAWLIEDINRATPSYIVLGFLDDDKSKHGMNINGYEVLGDVLSLEMLNQNHHAVAVIAMQNSKARQQIVEKFDGAFNSWETLIHPSVSISSTSAIGTGCIICSGTNVSVNSTIGDQCLLNISSTIENDCIVGNYASIMSGSIVGSHSKIGDYACLGSNCTILADTSIGENSVVYPGSVVTEDVGEESAVLGVPAKKVI